MKPLRLGTRGSRLALAQTQAVAARLRERGVEVEIVTIVTTGDVRPVDAPIGEGIFVTALEAALVSGEIDVAVHSAKDVPLESNPSLEIAAFPERADPRDALVTRGSAQSIAALPQRAIVGTDSPRRAGFLRALRADLQIVPLHGNVDTRLRRLDAGEADALLLAVAGLDRLGFGERIAERIAPHAMPPAPGQGALAVQARRDDAAVLALLSAIDDRDVRRAVVAERAVLRAVGGGCRAPVGALASANPDGGFTLVAGSVAPAGEPRHVIVVETQDAAAGSLARAAVDSAAELMRVVPQPTRAVLDPRAEPDADLAALLFRRGFRVISAPAFATEPGDAAALMRVRASLGSYDWVVLTSKRGVTALLDGNGAPVSQRVRWAAAGSATADAIRAHGLAVAAIPATPGGRGIAPAMEEHGALAGARVLLARADAADPALPGELRRRGATVDDVVAYRTIEAPERLASGVRDALRDESLEAVIFASGSAVRSLVALAGDDAGRAQRLAAFTVGPATTEVARAHGFDVVAQADSPYAEGIADAIEREYERRVTVWVESQLN